MYDVNFVRNLCRDITQEQDPERVDDLLNLLHAVINDDQEEVRLRMTFLARKYPITSGWNAAD
jgi:hypothetical protein